MNLHSNNNDGGFGESVDADDLPEDFKPILNPHTIISYGDRPSRVSYADWARNQFVLVARRSGDMVRSFDIAMVQQILLDLDQLQSSDQVLMLRGLWNDDAHGAVVIHVDFVYDHRDEPILTAEQIQAHLHDGMSWYCGQMISVEVTMVPASTSSDYFSSISDEYYEKTRKALYW